jgi:hypothetical protein
MTIQCSAFARSFILDGMNHGDSVVLGDWCFSKYCDLGMICAEQVDCMGQSVEGTRTWLTFADFAKAETNG